MTIIERAEPIVSVIVPVYNTAEYLTECVESILAQRESRLELIIVDDGSTDGSARIADSLALRDERVTVIHQRNRGVSAARNAGLGIARGTWVTFVDSDDWLDERFLGWMIHCARLPATSAHDKLPDVVVSTKVLSGSLGPKPRPRAWMVEPAAATAALLLPGIRVGSWNKLYRRAFLADYGIRFSTQLVMGEGLSFITDAAQRAELIVFTNRALYYYRRDNHASVTSRLTIEKMECALGALRRIRENLVLCDRRILDALDFHTWRTLFLAIAAESYPYRPGDGHSPLYHEATQRVRREGPPMLRTRALSAVERAKCAAIAFLPELSARLLATRWQRRLRG